jgi:HAD superfamily phosphatase (TIGR01668 family)
MNCLPVPTIMVGSIFDLRPEDLHKRDIKLLFLDLDNTMSPYHIDEPTQRLRDWVQSLKDSGIEPFILSNNHGQRPAIFARALDMGFVGRAGKPFTGTLRRVLAEKRAAPAHCAIAGDQIYTDVLCGSRVGLTTIAVRPISLRNPLLAIRYALEAPFRLLYRVRNRHV